MQNQPGFITEGNDPSRDGWLRSDPDVFRPKWVNVTGVAAVPSKLSHQLHIPRLPRPARLGLRSLPTRMGFGSAVSLPCHRAQSADGNGVAPALVNGWQRRAVREGLVATLLTSLLTSAVLASPESFRQSPAVTWRQFTTPALALGQLPDRGVLLDCP